MYPQNFGFFGSVRMVAEVGTLLADKGYARNAIREAVASKNAWANIPSRSTHNQRIAFAGWRSRQRNPVEGFFNRTKHFGGIATRYDKCPKNTSPPSNSFALACGAPHSESTT